MCHVSCVWYNPLSIMHLEATFDQWVARYGEIGLLVAMFFESSIVPIPSEAVVAAAGYFGIPFVAILVYGAVGSTTGAGVGYYLGRYAARPLLARYGRWIGLTPGRFQQAEAFARRHGLWGVLLGRLVPIVPFKVFSIASGAVALPLWGFIAMTFVGVIPRLALLAWLGDRLRHATAVALTALAVLGAAYGIWHLAQRRRKGET